MDQRLPLLAASSSGGGLVGVLWWLARQAATNSLKSEDRRFDASDLLSTCPAVEVWWNEVHLPSLALGVLVGILLVPLLDLVLVLRLRWRRLLQQLAREQRPTPLYRVLE